MSTSSPDALSDTKIFVLLAAIVFIFLIALGVAMTRVSRSRRNRYQEQARQQIVAAQQHPETLNKTILDLLPVFEVTAKRELRLIRSCTPRAGFSNCFTDDAIGCSTQPVPVASSTECSTPTPIQSMTASLDGGYAIESEKSSQDSIPLAYLRFSARQPGRDRPLEPAAGALCKATTDDIEMAAWENNCTSNKHFKRPAGRSVRMSPCSIGTPAPVAIRYYRPNTSQATTPQFSSRHSTAGYNWEGSTPGRNPEARMDFGAVVYRERSSQSLDLDHAAGLGGLGDATEHAQKCAATRAPHWSQPDIAHRRSHRLSAASDGGLGACPICLEEFDIGEQLRELPCLHKYHVVCIDTWLVSRSTCCPYCKLDIQRWYYGPSFEEEEQHRQGDVNQPIDFHEVPPVSSYNATTTQGPRHRRDRSGGSRLNRAMRAVHTALSNHGNVAM
ncbi:hypothetical protein IWW57_004866 [Coemansia sp. S610]|nr:hypothetical protein IWW57_004866 [Coemansia sp. S610]KAJ2415101.1 hypothetical protein GGI10_001923 [Coemansia sp. RSA 2530]KAJ2700341.1 hypothetical protein H4218_002074 [Coemansia sp. IMI 209128]